MLARSIPLALCLAFIAYESRFSASVFTQTVEAGFASIRQGIEETVGVRGTPGRRIASVKE